VSLFAVKIVSIWALYEELGDPDGGGVLLSDIESALIVVEVDLIDRN